MLPREGRRDPAAFSELYARHAATVYGWSRARIVRLVISAASVVVSLGLGAVALAAPPAGTSVSRHVWSFVSAPGLGVVLVEQLIAVGIGGLVRAHERRLNR
jgi:hypothetical protein